MQKKMGSKFKKSKTIFLLVVLLSTILLFACDNQKKFKDLKVYIENLKQTISIRKKQNKTPELPLPLAATYTAANLRTPFAGAQILPKAKGGVVNPLQAYPINMLKFVGTLIENKVSYAYILAPDNKVYQVKIGDIIGNHYGKIVNISATRIEVNEESSEIGKPITRSIVTLELKDER